MRLLVAMLLLLIAAPAWAQQGQGMSQALVVSSCGGGALPSGAVNQLAMDTTGRLCQSGIGSNVCSQATAYLARTTGGNEGGNAVNITALICGLVTDGLIDGTLTGAAGCGSHLDAMYILAQQNAADAKLNLCGTAYTISPSTATFTSYKGYSAFPIPAMDTGFNPNTLVGSGIKFVQDSASISVWAYDAPEASKVLMGTSGALALTYLGNFSGSLYCDVNSTGDTALVSPGTNGLYSCDRSSSTNINFYFNGVSLGTQSISSGIPANVDIYIGGRQDGFNTVKTVSEAHFGGSLSAPLKLAMYNRLRTYMTAVGVP